MYTRVNKFKLANNEYKVFDNYFIDQNNNKITGIEYSILHSLYCSYGNVSRAIEVLRFKLRHSTNETTNMAINSLKTLKMW